MIGMFTETQQGNVMNERISVGLNRTLKWVFVCVCCRRWRGNGSDPSPATFLVNKRKPGQEFIADHPMALVMPTVSHDVCRSHAVSGQIIVRGSCGDEPFSFHVLAPRSPRARRTANHALPRPPPPSRPPANGPSVECHPTRRRPDPTPWTPRVTHVSARDTGGDVRLHTRSSSMHRQRGTLESDS